MFAFLIVFVKEMLLFVFVFVGGQKYYEQQHLASGSGRLGGISRQIPNKPPLSFPFFFSQIQIHKYQLVGISRQIPNNPPLSFLFLFKNTNTQKMIGRHMTPIIHSFLFLSLISLLIFQLAYCIFWNFQVFDTRGHAEHTKIIHPPPFFTPLCGF